VGAETKIEWAHHTFNGWWGCEKVSAACKFCYAEAFARRWNFKIWGKKSPRRFFGDAHWNEPLKWNREAEKEKERKRVFCGSMMDICERRKDLDGPRKRIFALAEQTPWLIWLFLTKRPEEYLNILPVEWLRNPRSNVWLGATVEDETQIHRAKKLIETPAIVHFLSCEPLLSALPAETFLGIDWVIVGGESGSKARQLNPEFVKDIYNKCKSMGIPFFFKQCGMNTGRNSPVSMKPAGYCSAGNGMK
jgi:protein gp37